MSGDGADHVAATIAQGIAALEAGASVPSLDLSREEICLQLIEHGQLLAELKSQIANLEAHRWQEQCIGGASLWPRRPGFRKRLFVRRG